MGSKTYKGITIKNDGHRWEVREVVSGSTYNQDTLFAYPARFKTLRAAKDFIDRMAKTVK